MGSQQSERQKTGSGPALFYTHRNSSQYPSGCGRGNQVIVPDRAWKFATSNLHAGTHDNDFFQYFITANPCFALITMNHKGQEPA